MPDFLFTLSLLIFFSPLIGFVLLALLGWLQKIPSETWIVHISRSTLVFSFLAAMVLMSQTFVENHVHLYRWGTWFQSGDHQFVLSFLIDRLSVTMILLTTMLCSLIGHFSITYLHADKGFLRFFLLLQAFAVGMLLLVMAGGVELLFVGWELVGLTSALLIMYFHERSAPVRHGLRAFIIYRFCDVGLLVGMIYLHHFAHTSSFQSHLSPGHWMSGMAHAATGPVTFVALLFTLAAIGKSAQLPVGGWLPRAMEGPTPSSAIFYGGLSVHAGVYLLLRAEPLFENSPWACIVLILVGSFTAIFSTLMGRIQTDIKNSLAYATMTQVGIMFIEIGLHLNGIATIHMVGHACLRTWQLLRSPSVLHELHVLRGSLDHEFETGGWLDNIERWLPGNIGRALYLHSLQRFYIESVLQRVFIRPVLWLANLLATLERDLFFRKSDSNTAPQSSKAVPQKTSPLVPAPLKKPISSQKQKGPRK